MTWSGEKLKEAWTHLRNNSAEVQASHECVCIQCGAYFAPAEIREWLNESYKRVELSPSSDHSEAFCPNCGGYYVLGDASGLPIRDEQFLKAMNS